VKILEIEGHTPALILAGMHRSGTSYVASMLKQASVDMGSRLIGPTKGNTKGHFENIDFVEFHARVLVSYGLDSRGWNAPKIVDVPNVFMEMASLLVQENSRTNPWGFKDPRVCLFLDFWRQALPSAKFLCVFRSPWEVLSSLIRRGTDLPLLENPQSILDCWLHYCSSLVEFCQAFPERSILFEINTLTANWEKACSLISEKFNIPLDASGESTFEPSLFIRKPHPGYDFELNEQFFPEVDSLWKELTELAAIPVDRHPEPESPRRCGQELTLVDVVNEIKEESADLQGESYSELARLSESEHRICDEMYRLRNENLQLHDQLFNYGQTVENLAARLEQERILKSQYENKILALQEAHQKLLQRCEALEREVSCHQVDHQELKICVVPPAREKHEALEAICDQ
jgi:hypothetical protein